MQGLAFSSRLAKPSVHQARRNVSAGAGNLATTQFNVKVRPYTLRTGDSLATIAKKRGITLEQLTSINQDANPDKFKEGQTILIPADKLSSRDREILDGIGSSYRIYPVRNGEKLSDIISKRGISIAEVVVLNPGIDLDNLSDNQLLKLPVGKFTVREREMLIGSGILPPEFFAAAKNPFVIGAGALLAVCAVILGWQRVYFDPDEEPVEDEPAKTA